MLACDGEGNIIADKMNGDQLLLNNSNTAEEDHGEA